jgi:hypothetical protein
VAKIVICCLTTAVTLGAAPWVYGVTQTVGAASAVVARLRAAIGPADDVHCQYERVSPADSGGSRQMEMWLALPGRIIQTEHRRTPSGGGEERREGYDGERLIGAQSARLSAEMQVRLIEAHRRAAQRLQLLWFGEFSRFETRYVGDAVSDEGVKVDVLEVAPPAGEKVTIFIEKKTSLIVMAKMEENYRTVERDSSRRGRDKSVTNGTAITSVYQSDFRTKNGVTLPYRTAIQIGAQLIEEWVLSACEINTSAFDKEARRR